MLVSTCCKLRGSPVEKGGLWDFQHSTWPVGLSGGEKWACITTGLTGSMSYAPFWSFHHSKAGTSICECVRIWEWTGENLLRRGKDEQRLILRPCSSTRMWIQVDRENNQNHNWKISMKVNGLIITLCSQLRQLSLPQKKKKIIIKGGWRGIGGGGSQAQMMIF